MQTKPNPNTVSQQMILKPVSYFPHKCTPYEHFTTRGAHTLAEAASVDFYMLTLTLLYKVP